MNNDYLASLGCLEINYIIGINCLKKMSAIDVELFSKVDDFLEKGFLFHGLSDFNNLTVLFLEKNNEILVSISLRPWDKLSLVTIEIMKLLNDCAGLFFSGFELFFDMDNIEKTLFEENPNYPIFFKKEESNIISIFDKFSSAREIEIVKNILKPVFSKYFMEI